MTTSTPPKLRVKCHLDGMKWGEWITEGETYTVTPPRSKRGDYHFWNDERHCGTFMRPHQFDRAVKAGWLTIKQPALSAD